MVAWLALSRITARGDACGVHHDCSHGHGHAHDSSDDEGASTGFLPITLAASLFVTGLFVLGYVKCDPEPTAAASTARE